MVRQHDVPEFAHDSHKPTEQPPSDVAEAPTADAAPDGSSGICGRSSGRTFDDGSTETTTFDRSTKSFSGFCARRLS
jgi:hypothetical protein